MKESYTDTLMRNTIAFETICRGNAHEDSRRVKRQPNV